MVDKNATFYLEIKEDADSGCVVRVGGVIDENADLSPLMGLRAKAVRVDMAEVRRINSFGVRSWLETIAKISREVALEFVECPPPIIDQCNMVRGFLGHGSVVSFYAMMVCEACDEEIDQLFATASCATHGGALPPTPCPRCGRAMEIDDIEEQYLSFLRAGP